MFGKIKKTLKEFDSMYSIAEKLYHMAILLIIFGFGSISGFLASITPILKGFGYFGVFLSFLVSILLIVLILYFYSSSILSREQSKYISLLSNTKTEINPLSEGFKDEIIHLEDLRLPLSEPQKNKTFRRCRLIGPLTIGILGGHYESCHFVQSGSTIALSSKVDGPVHLPGVLIFENCSFYECVFVHVTIITTQDIAKLFKNTTPGVHVVGLE
ncbi:hypothetical protein [Enterobacter roggenkampii]|uniref:hypothetical protein n=1 Tax=Enterobacter roggenkampii TaxID=1812935 RepID=UPI003D701ADB